MPDGVHVSDVTVWFNPRCSKCRGADALLRDHGIEPEHIRYLDDPPPRAEIEHVLELLGTDDPRDMMRTAEGIYRELGLADADREQLLDAMEANPILIQRPIVIRGQSAVIARPPERLLDLL